MSEESRYDVKYASRTIKDIAKSLGDGNLGTRTTRLLSEKALNECADVLLAMHARIKFLEEQIEKPSDRLVSYLNQRQATTIMHALNLYADYAMDHGEPNIADSCCRLALNYNRWLNDNGGPVNDFDAGASNKVYLILDPRKTQAEAIYTSLRIIAETFHSGEEYDDWIELTETIKRWVNRRFKK